MPDQVPIAAVLHDETAADDPRLLAAVKEYSGLLEAGPIARDQFLARHSDIAAQIVDYLDGLEMVHSAAREVRQTAADLAQPPKVLGDFRILREIGRGGMGVVYEALHLSLARRVALKVLPFVNSFDSTRLQRFRIEAQAAARLQHPNIVQVYSVGSENGIHFFAMQLIEGFSLAAVIARLRKLHGNPSPSGLGLAVARRGQSEGEPAVGNDHSDARSSSATQQLAHQSTDRFGDSPLDTLVLPPPDVFDQLGNSNLVNSYARSQSYFRQVAQVIHQAALALEHAHQCGVLHRDIKPGNLLLDAANHVWVTDFGLARISTDAQLTHTGTPLGTLRYMSPEQAAGNAGIVDQRTDVYSLGVTLYELLTLEPAVPGDESHTLLRRVIEDEPRAPRILDKNVPVELETIVLKAVAKTRDERYLSAQQLAEDLQRWLDDKPILARPPSIWERAAKWRRRHSLLVRTAAVFTWFAACGLGLATVLVSRAYQSEAEQRKAAVASFEQARRAVDEFSEMGENELAAKPELRDVRRRLLETALGYYREFEKEHRADSVALADMSATTRRIEHIIDELKVVEGAAPLLLLSNSYVQVDLKLSEAQRNTINTILGKLRREDATAEAAPENQDQTPEERLATVLRTHEQALSTALTPAQAKRLQQIARQQRAPFVFRSDEIIAALKLSPEQRRQVNTIIEEERVDGRGRQPTGQGDDRGAPDHRGGPLRHHPPPHEVRELEAMLNDMVGPGESPVGPPRDRPPFDGPPRDRPLHDGPPPGGLFGAPPPPPPSARRNGGDSELTAARHRTVDRILGILSPEQQGKWEELTGAPFRHDLNWGPDDLVPQ